MSLGVTPTFNLSPDDQIFQKGKPPSGIGYHNIGQLRTPYFGKNSNFSSNQGDYAPPQRTRYYTLEDPLAPYPMMERWQATQYLPTQGCAFGVPGQFPTVDDSVPDSGFVPPNYFSPSFTNPKGQFPHPSQTYGKHLIQNISKPTKQNTFENFEFMNTPPQFALAEQYEGNYVKLIDVYPRLQKNNPPYRDGEKYKY
jgi:hypothetical protein